MDDFHLKISYSSSYFDCTLENNIFVFALLLIEYKGLYFIVICSYEDKSMKR